MSILRTEHLRWRSVGLWLLLLVLIPKNLAALTMAFVRTPALPWSPTTRKTVRRNIFEFSLQSSRTDRTDNAEPPLRAMRISEIRAQLDDLNIDYKDCFDKESLIQRLQDARAGKVAGGGGVKLASDEANTESTESAATPVSDRIMTKDDDTGIDDVSTMSVKELRQELSRYNIRWAGLLEKSDLIRAVQQARQAAMHFSVTGLLRPGQVTSLTAEEVQAEIATAQGSSASTSSPLLLDVYAVWCGPCQFMAKQLQEAAQVWGDRVRVAKMDSDQHPQYAAQLKVQGLPTLILFHHGTEVGRMEGALTKDQLVQWVERQL